MLDVLISFDSTGSMYPCLAEARRKISEIITRLFNEYPDLRVGIIAHGDYCDRDTTYVISEFQLSDNRADIVQFVNTVKPTNGGDGDECYELVLNRARTFGWRDEVKKIMIMVGDANPHMPGYRYHDHVNMLNWKMEARMLAVENDVTIYTVKCLNGSSTFWNEVARIGNGVKLDLHQFNNILELFSLVVYKSISNDRVEVYQQELQSAGLLNRNLASIIDSLLGKSTARVVTEHEGLREVDPTRFQMLHVDHTCAIKSFVETSGVPYKKGRGFYELTKREEVQERKEIVLRNKLTGDMFSGSAARDLVGLPYGERGNLYPKYGFDYDIFVQSTSVNRKLMPHTRFLYET